MDSDTLELILRSRPTILEIVDARGYDVDTYKNVSPLELKKLAITNPSLLTIRAVKKPDGPAPVERITVLYWMDPVRLKMKALPNTLWDDANPEHYDPAADEIMVITNEPDHPVFDAAAASQWNLRRARMCFFQLKHLISNPSKHSFVFPHRKLGASEAEQLIKSLHLKSQAQLPRILYHVDIQARVLGLVPGDIVEISRSSESAGIYKVYRLCSV